MGKDTELAILFADVVGSTRLFEVLGDARARDLVTACVDAMREATGHCHGTVIKTMGDEIMATFARCDDALDAAVRIQRGIRNNRALRVDGHPVTVRIGCHFGPVVVENRDVFGAAVHTANRMTSQAKAQQVIITEAVVDRLSPDRRGMCRKIDVAVPRGQQGKVELHEVLWQEDDDTVTSMLPTLSELPDQHRRFRLRVRYDGRELLLDDRDRTALTIGRGDDNDLVVRGTLVSRVHARIEAAKSRFMLIDQSTNGSFVVNDHGEEAFVRRDAVALKGKGTIGFGHVPEGDSYHTIEFSCED
ncbi:MAG: FHA domain-containing protein [Steroidobacteraceae bacterium]|nr:FHA domain-containing protein [Steroidobacteraceae bacterium]MCC7198268.1 FHA domain-containing protein [Gammaproteobacteria bacterium]